MRFNIYSIFDEASGLYSRPFFSQSNAEALRSFSDISVDATHPIGQHPKDYTLFRLGVFDDMSGTMIDEPNLAISTALEAVAATRNVDPAHEDLVTQLKNHIGKQADA